MNIDEAKAHLSKLIREAESGEEIIVCRRGKPVARILPLKRTAQDPQVYSDTDVPRPAAR